MYRQTLGRVGIALLATLWIVGCTHSIEAPQSAGFQNAEDYCWPSTALNSGVHYTIYAGSTLDSVVDQHTLVSTDGSHVQDHGTSTVGGFRLSRSSDRVVIDSIGQNTVFLVPPGVTFLSDQPTAASVRSLVILPSGRLIAATDYNGIYYSDNRSDWHRASGANGSVLAMTFDSIRKVLYASVGSTLLQSTSQGESWTVLRQYPVNEHIAAMAADGNGTVYVAHGAIVDTATAPWRDSSFVAFRSVSADVTGLCAGFQDSIQDVAIVAGPIVSLFQNGQGVGTYSAENISSISMPTFGSVMLTTKQLIIRGGFSDASHWKTVGQLPDSNLVDAVDAGTGMTYLADMSGRIYQLAGTNVTLFKALDATIYALQIEQGNTLMISTDAGVWQLTTNGTLQSLNGPNFGGSISGTSGLTLLSKVNDNLQVGDTWPAGSLFISSLQQAVPLTARVLDHVDSLISTTGERFGETYVVRYAFEAGGAVGSIAPLYWQVYYTLGVGASVIEQYGQDNTGAFAATSRAVLVP